MDRRFFTWLMLTSAMFFLYLSMRPQVPQGKPPAGQAAAKKDAAPPNADPLLQKNAPKAEIEGDPSDVPGENAAAGQNDLPDAKENGDKENTAKPNNPPAAFTLGSMDPTKGYNLQVTLTTRGAGIEHAELVGQPTPGKFKFRALEHDGGYLGYLGLTQSLKGLRVRTVPDGSPAALARCKSIPGGIKIGDTLQEVGGVSIDSQLGLERALKETKPGQAVDLVVQRTIAGNQTGLQFTATLSEAPLDILRTSERSSEVIPGNYKRPSLRTTLASLDKTNIPVGEPSLPALSESLDIDWAASIIDVPGGEGIEFRLPLDSFLAGTGRPEKLELVKRYRLLPASADNDGYLLDVETVIVNHNDQDVGVSFRQEGLTGLSLEGWWFSIKISPYMFSGAGQRDVIYNSELDSHQLITTRQIQSLALKTPQQPDRILFSENEPPEARNLRYIGLDSQYFNASLLPHRDSPDVLRDLRQAGASAIANPSEIPKARAQGTNTSFWFDTKEQIAPANSEISRRYHVFIGPKDTDILASHGLVRAIEYGWFPWIAKPLSAILHFFHMIVRNYALAIVLLTVMVRGMMFPLGRKAAMNAQRMQELQPQMKKINEQYKDNLEKRGKAMQELYAKHNFKPLAGCLPMFIQLPIFIGLYRCLSVDISLRQEPLSPWLSWCSNLAAPDQLIAWSSWMPEFISGRGTGWLGPYFNILPMVTVGLFLLQQKMLMPKATDEQTRMTQNMMQVMTIFMGVLFFKVPSGLCIYFITSSFWSLIERKLVKKLMPPPNTNSAANLTASTNKETNPDPAPKRGKKTNRDRSASQEVKPAGRLNEWKELLNKPSVKSATQRGSSKNTKGSRKKIKKRKR